MSRSQHQQRSVASRMTQPQSMRTRAYVYGVDKLNGYDAWALFKASAAGDVSKIKELLDKDPRLVNAQHWYQFPIHMAVRDGRPDVVKLLLDRGADPGQSRFLYDSWNKLLRVAEERGYADVAAVLVGALQKRFNYSPDFQRLRDAIVARDSRKINGVLRRSPELALASDVLGNNAIHWSVVTRQLTLINRFIELGTPIDARRADGQTPVQLAANEAYDYWYRGARGRKHPSIRNAWVMVGQLLARGAKYTASVAAAVGDQEQLEHLIRKDPGRATQLDSSRVSPLSYAAREGYTHIVQLLLDHGADPNMPEDLASGGRALFEACGGNHLEAAELLLQHGANPNAGVDSCGCCLTICEHQHRKAAKPLSKLLREYGAYTPPYAMTRKELRQALHADHEVIHDGEFLAAVIETKSGSLLDLYLDKLPRRSRGAQVYAGIACPQSAAQLRAMLARGLDPNQTEWLGKTLLHACGESGDRSMAEMILNAGADINAKDVDFKGTPLATAVRHAYTGEQEERSTREERQKQMVEFLLQQGAAANLPDDEPWATPLAWAKERKLREIETMLKQHGATA